jgi:hypothetical protein
MPIAQRGRETEVHIPTSVEEGAASAQSTPFVWNTAPRFVQQHRATSAAEPASLADSLAAAC